MNLHSIHFAFCRYSLNEHDSQLLSNLLSNCYTTDSLSFRHRPHREDTNHFLDTVEQLFAGNKVFWIRRFDGFSHFRIKYCGHNSL